MSATSTLELAIAGMSCGSCVRHVSEALREVPGVSTAQVDLERGRASVEYDAASTTAAQMVAAVEGAGYSAAVAA